MGRKDKCEAAAEAKAAAKAAVAHAKADEILPSDGVEAEEEVEDTPFIKSLKEIDDKYLALEQELDKAQQEIRKKYMAMQEPILKKRAEALARKGEGEDAETGTPACPGFWLLALQNHSVGEGVEEWDEPVLKYLKDITSTDTDPCDTQKGFKLGFHFASNPFFENETLWKTYTTEKTNPYTDEMTCSKVECSEITWKPGKNVTVEKVQKKVKGGGAKKNKQKAKGASEEPRDSFFRHFFRTLEPEMAIPEDMNLGEEAEEYEDEAMMLMIIDNDLDMGSDVRDQLIPYAVRWYTGEASPDDDDEDDSDEDDDDDDDEEDDDEDEDSDESDEEPQSKSKGKTKGKKGSPAVKPSGDPANKEECKQQ